MSAGMALTDLPIPLPRDIHSDVEDLSAQLAEARPDRIISRCTPLADRLAYRYSAEANRQTV